MDLTLWLAFVGASFIIAIIPGPGVTTVVGYALSGGRSVAFSAVAGAVVGNFCAASLSLTGMGLLLAQSAIAFSVVKWAGAAYLIGLGIYSILKSKRPNCSSTDTFTVVSSRAAFWGTSLVTALHPKTILFFMAFAPQFISLQHDYWIQAAALVGTFCSVLAITDSLYALTASAASIVLHGERARLWSRRVGGGALLAAGVATAAARN